MKKLLLFALITIIYISCSAIEKQKLKKVAKDLKILYLTSPKPGKYHDYISQEKIIKKIISHYIGAKVDTIWDAKLYTHPKLADNYDFIIMNFCFGRNNKSDIPNNLSNIIKKGKNVLVLHCVLHSFRYEKNNTWHKTLGLTSFKHDKKYAFPLKKVSNHPIVKNIRDDWTTPIEELYYITKQETGVYPLHVAKSKNNNTWHPINWIYRHGKGIIIGSSLGHYNNIYTTIPFQKYIVNSILWASGNKIQYKNKATSLKFNNIPLGESWKKSRKKK